jgi:D-sedoheptulose 7-phosphate isomerase
MSDAPVSDWMNEQLGDHVATAQAMEQLLPAVREVAARLVQVYENDRVLYTLGNGGSAADAQHFTGELIGHYKRDRRPLAAVTLTTDPTVMTCIANDYSYDEVFERQVHGFVRDGDVVIGFSTSGRSPNVVRGLAAARELGAVTVLFTGHNGGEADLVLAVPSESTARIQEMHVLLLHVILEEVDRWAAGS